MDNAFSRIVGIIIAVILMFIAPVKIMNEKKSQIIQNYIFTETTVFLDGIRNTGRISSKDYLDFQNAISFDNDIYKVEFTHMERDTDKINFTKTIEDVIMSGKEYYFKQGDIVRIVIKNSKNEVVAYYGGSIKDEDY